ncbi:MarR family winged helix-turn-helix transcriptional regulator [Streptomyces sp. NPDC096311]|uniref:MarR family winged helix-turn-helix transcriptional regulator n=1 Tax=Streptomyces sp. NPDC096311 TaxID=3366083 RepID=UPI0038257D48
MTALSNTPDDQPFDLTWLLSRASQRMRGELDAVAREHGLAGLRDWVVLTALTAVEGRTQLQLGKELGVDKTTLTSLLDRLESEGLVVRRFSPSDRRARIPEVTDAGRGIQAKVVQSRDEAEARLLAGFSERERELLRALLSRLADETEGAAGPCLGEQ